MWTMTELCFDLFGGALWCLCGGVLDIVYLSREGILHNIRPCKALKVPRLLLLWGKPVIKLEGNSAWIETPAQALRPPTHTSSDLLAREPCWLPVLKPRQAWRDYSLSKTFNSELIRLQDKNHPAMLPLNSGHTINMINNNNWSHYGGNLLHSSKRGLLFWCLCLLGDAEQETRLFIIWWFFPCEQVVVSGRCLTTVTTHTHTHTPHV